MNKMRAWGFAVGLAIAWSIAVAVCATRVDEAHRVPSTLAGPRDGSRGNVIR
jgi:hypothetical protein